MIEEIELGGIKVPLRDLEITPESIKQVLKILLEERKETKQRIEELGNVLDLWSTFLERCQRTNCNWSYPQIQNTTNLITPNLFILRFN